LSVKESSIHPLYISIVKYTEFLCNDQPLEIGRKPSGSGGEDNTNNGNGQLNAERQQQSGCILLDRQGRILYSYLCTDSSDWPDVEVLLEQVRRTINKVDYIYPYPYMQ